jgi:adenosylmethionine-8-amino-7-oxononanoate aminotransferase
VLDNEAAFGATLSKLLDLPIVGDVRGDVVVQVAPPLICGQAEFDDMEQILRHTLTEAQKLV